MAPDDGSELQVLILTSSYHQRGGRFRAALFAFEPPCGSRLPCSSRIQPAGIKPSSMMNYRTFGWISIAAIAIAGLGGSAPAQQTCIADWSEAGPIVRKEGLAPIEWVGKLARDRASVEIVGSALCRAQDRYVYRLTVRAGQGTLRTMVVDARKPFEP